jgi:hypothetical protein
VASGDLSGAAIGRRLAETEAEADALDAGLMASAAPDVIALHPKALDYYLAAVTTLAETLAARQEHAAIKPIRELVDSIIVYPRQAREPLRFDINGRLAALLNSADGKGPGPVMGWVCWCQGQNRTADTRIFNPRCPSKSSFDVDGLDEFRSTVAPWWHPQCAGTFGTTRTTL